MIRQRLALGSLVVLASVALAIPSHAQPPVACLIDESLIVDHSPLANVAQALESRHALRVLALGSMSTAGGGTSSATSWPARLQVVLQGLLQGAEIVVVNRGKARQTAADMLERLDAEVREATPDLVIWESGVVDALRNIDPQEYAETVLAGADRLAERKIDLILMDAQFTRASSAVIDFEPYRETVRQVAAMRGLINFPRFELMHRWISDGTYVIEGLKRPEQLVVADRIYDCLARHLGRMIANGIETARAEARAENETFPQRRD